MTDVTSYQRWWPWLRSFEAATLAVDEVWRCSVKAPLGYSLSFSLKFEVVVPEHHIEASVRGDILGGAWIDLEERGAASDVWVRSMFVPASPFLQRLSKFAPPVARLGHDLLLRQGARQFNERALKDRDAQRES